MTLIAHDVDCRECNTNGVAPDGWACLNCDGRGYVIVRCPGGGIDDLCTSDPYECGLCRPGHLRPLGGSDGR